jgi:crossover junction endodeoxyribonuclease RuvC
MCSRTQKTMRVLAIDPGYGRMGLAVVEGDPSKPTFVYSDCIETNKEDEGRLATIAQALTDSIDTYSPNLVAIESLFFSNNAKTALKVGEARGALLSVVQARGIPVKEYSPQQIKMAVTGNGAADKVAVSRMIPHLITLPEKKRLDDEMDALALGICALSHKLS